ncbi:hypothetical protein KBD71_02875 [Candidatus Woesebacteria bacterium]|nr:hypothetical protein [Candidatus Woesebacteria bacterium]
MMGRVTPSFFMDSQRTLTRPPLLVEDERMSRDGDPSSTEILDPSSIELATTRPHFVLRERTDSDLLGLNSTVATYAMLDSNTGRREIPKELPFQPDKPTNYPEFVEQTLLADSTSTVFKPMRYLNPYYTQVDESGHTVLIKAMPEEPSITPETDQVLASAEYKIEEVETYLKENLTHGSFTLYTPEPITLHAGIDVATVLKENVEKLSGGDDLDNVLLLIGRIAPVQQLEDRIPDAVSMVLTKKDGTHLARLLIMPDVEYPDPTQKEPQVFLGTIADQLAQVVSLGVPELSRLGLSAKEQELLNTFPIQDFSPIFRLEYDVRSNVLVINDQFFTDIGPSYQEHPQGAWVNVFAYAVRSFDSFAPAVNAERIEQAKEDAETRKKFINNLQPIELSEPPIETTSPKGAEISVALLQSLERTLFTACQRKLEQLAIVSEQGDVITQIQEVFKEVGQEIDAITQSNVSALDKLHAFQDTVGSSLSLTMNNREAILRWEELATRLDNTMEALFVSYVETQLQGNSAQVLLDVSESSQTELASLINQNVPTTERREYSVDGTQVDEDTFNQTIKYQFFHRLFGKARSTGTRFVREPSVQVSLQDVYTDALTFLGITDEINAGRMEGALQAAQAYQDLLTYKRMCQEESIEVYTGMPFAFKYEYRTDLIDVFQSAGISPQDIAFNSQLIAQEEVYSRMYSAESGVLPTSIEESRHQRRVVALETQHRRIQEKVERPILERFKQLEKDLDELKAMLERRFLEAGIPPEQIESSLPDTESLAKLLIASANECLDDIQTIDTLYTDARTRLEQVGITTTEFVYFQNPVDRELEKKRWEKQTQSLKVQQLYTQLSLRLFEMAAAKTA